MQLKFSNVAYYEVIINIIPAMSQIFLCPDAWVSILSIFLFLSCSLYAIQCQLRVVDNIISSIFVHFLFQISVLQTKSEITCCCTLILLLDRLFVLPCLFWCFIQDTHTFISFYLLLFLNLVLGLNCSI